MTRRPRDPNRRPPRSLNKAPWVATDSDGLWAAITMHEAAQCLVCRGMMLPGEPVMCSPGLWVRHPTCRWPREARGVDEQTQIEQTPRHARVITP